MNNKSPKGARLWNASVGLRLEAVRAYSASGNRGPVSWRGNQLDVDGELISGAFDDMTSG